MLRNLSFLADFDLLRESDDLRTEATAPIERRALDADAWNYCDSKGYLH
jgi:hypothetical protein